MQKIFVVSHTHWDREWYSPFQVYRARLIRCVDKLLDIFATDPAYQYFLLDGQTIVLEDYLEVRPDREQTLRDLVHAGKLQIGPWYVLPDEFLVSGEAIIRNLVRGIHIAREFGDTMSVGYLPDPFGHISQIPQILRELGIATAVFRRGLADEPTEVWWHAPDGSRVMACYLRDSYDNAAWLNRDDANFARGFEKVYKSLAPHAVTSNLLLMNGTDHMEPWDDLPHLLNIARDQIRDVEIIHAALPMYVQATQTEIAERNIELDAVRGELRNPKRHHLLPGVLSARTWIKQRNTRAQMLLEKWAEPFTAFANLIQPPTSHLQLLDLAWKYLLQNHPHDSICGCGVDQTHAEMALRFDWVEQIVEPIIAENLQALAANIDTHTDHGVPIIVFNPIASARTDHVNVQIEMPSDARNFIITDESGQALPFQIRSQRVQAYYHKRARGTSLGGLLGMVRAGRIQEKALQDVVISANENPIRVDITLASHGEPNYAALDRVTPEFQRLVAENANTLFEINGHSPTQFEIEFMARNVPGLGYKTFFASPGVAPKPELHSTLILENEFYRVEPNRDNGTLTITDKLTGTIYRDINRFVDGGDRGDLYNYCPPENDQLVREPVAPPEIESNTNNARASLRIAMSYRLAKELADTRTDRSPETIENKIETVVSLYPGVPRIDFQTRVENLARDHRLRVEFPSPIVTSFADAEQAFDVVHRSLDLPQDTSAWIEQPRPEAPIQNFVSISDGKIGLTLATRGLPEYEARRDEHGTTIVLTLLRCVGWLSRDDLTVRSGHAGPALETPGAQEIGVHHFEYALIPTQGDWRNTFSDAHAFAVPMRAIPTSLHGGTLARVASFTEATPREFVFSTIKPSENGTGLIVRGYNLGDETIDVTLNFLGTFSRASRVNLNEEEIAPLILQDHHTTFKVRSKEIVTYKFVA